MAADHDLNGWLRRGAVAKCLGVSIATVRRFEGMHLTPIRDGKGEHRFDPAEVDALAAKRRRRGKRKARRRVRGNVAPAESPSSVKAELRVSGAVTKRAFQLFEKGVSRANVAIELEEAVENVNWLHENWLVMSGRKGTATGDGSARGRPEFRVTTEAEVRARPQHLLSEEDRELLRWADRIEEENRRVGQDPA